MSTQLALPAVRAAASAKAASLARIFRRAILIAPKLGRTMSECFNYVGTELELFQHAKNWKGYWGRLIQPYLGDSVLEVGAGFGASTEAVCRIKRPSRWVCLEPDATLVSHLRDYLDKHDLSFCETLVGESTDLKSGDQFDSILYIDVLEHIADDQTELTRISQFLKPGGALIILVPAHQSLYTEFDKAIGHFRRYDFKSLRAVIPPPLVEEKLVYLDSVGALASLANRLLLRQARPTVQQILFWDRLLVPISERLDPVLGYTTGKSVLGVWTQPK